MSRAEASPGGQSIRPVLATKRSDAVYEVLEQLISSGQLPPGSRFPPERDLAAQLSVSRNSVREAVRELELKQLVERKAGRGTVVLALPSDGHRSLLDDLASGDRDLLEIMDFRLTIEPPIAAHAAARRTRGSLLTLERLLEEMKGETRPDRVAELDRAFHASVALATHNQLLVRLSEVTSEWLRQSRRETLQSRRRRAASLEGHRRIYEAVRAGDSEAAREAMAAHVMQVREIIGGRSTDGDA
jgi:GntR family transcriptional regulator, transcriptional repressor for pyruvate dehydrogenase complex